MGDFFYQQTDFELKLTRSYHSKSDFKGHFGESWSMEYEVSLQETPEGLIRVRDYASGAHLNFYPLSQKKGEYVTKGSSGQFISKNLKGFVLRTAEGKIQKFDLSGRLESVCVLGVHALSFTKDYCVTLLYSKGNKIEEIRDNQAHFLQFELDSRGFLKQIKTEKNKVYQYTINNFGDLIAFKDPQGKKIRYHYKAPHLQRHLLERIEYPEGSEIRITYLGEDQNERVHSVLDLLGTYKEYAYLENKTDSNMKVITVSTKYADTPQKNLEKYQYQFKKNAVGQQWLYELKINRNGDDEVTEFNECCQLPIKIITPLQNEERLDYDSLGRLIEKTDSRKKIKITYVYSASHFLSNADHSLKMNKIKQVEMIKQTMSQTNRTQKVQLNYEYDSLGQMTLAQSSRGERLEIRWEKGLLIGLSDQVNRKLKLYYQKSLRGFAPQKIGYEDSRLGKASILSNKNKEIMRASQIRKQWGDFARILLEATHEKLSI